MRALRCAGAAQKCARMRSTRPMLRTIVVLCAVATGCKGKDNKGDEPPQKPVAGSASAGPATGSAPGSAEGAASAPAGSAAGDERCASPCRFLATVALADIVGEVKKTCGTDWKPAAADDCDQPDY